MTPLERLELDLLAKRQVSWDYLLDYLAQLSEPIANDEWKTMLKRRAKACWQDWRNACNGLRELYAEEEREAA